MTEKKTTLFSTPYATFEAKSYNNEGNVTGFVVDGPENLKDAIHREVINSLRYDNNGSCPVSIASNSSPMPLLRQDLISGGKVPNLNVPCFRFFNWFEFYGYKFHSTVPSSEVGNQRFLFKIDKESLTEYSKDNEKSKSGSLEIVLTMAAYPSMPTVAPRLNFHGKDRRKKTSAAYPPMSTVAPRFLQQKHQR